MRVPEGGIVALLGSNGAGKSTLLKAMSGILYTEEGVIENGTIRFRNEDVHRLAPDELVRRGIVQVPEGRRVFPALTIDENLQMGGYTRTAAEARDRRDKVFALFPRLFERRDQIAGYMSGGEQQMLAIGRALMTGPVLLALDEPSLGLAPLIIDRIYEVIARLRDEMKMTVLLVEQNAQRALDIADYAYILETGRVVLDGTAQKLVVQRGRAGVLSRRIRLGPQKPARRQALQAAQEVAVVTALLAVENISKSFGGLKAVSDVSLTVTPGEICSVIGPNGAGKTTLFNIISGVLRPSAGRIMFDGTDLARVSPWRFAAIGIGRTFQNLALFKHGTVVENILTGRHTHLRSSVLDAVLFFGRTRREEIDARRRVEEIIEFLEIEHIRDAIVGTLSYGQQKRVELARARLRAEAAAARRNGVGHEPGGDRGHRPLRARYPRRTGHHGGDDRARDADRDGHLRPRSRPEFRPQDRGRHAGRGAARSGRRRGLSRRPSRAKPARKAVTDVNA